jgi:hypothetical protein
MENRIFDRNAHMQGKVSQVKEYIKKGDLFYNSNLVEEARSCWEFALELLQECEKLFKYADFEPYITAIKRYRIYEVDKAEEPKKVLVSFDENLIEMIKEEKEEKEEKEISSNFQPVTRSAP